MVQWMQKLVKCKVLFCCIGIKYKFSQNILGILTNSFHVYSLHFNHTTQKEFLI